MQPLCLQQGTKQGGRPLVIRSLVCPEVGLIGGPINGVQLTAQGGFKALERPLPLLDCRAVGLALPSL